VAEKRSYKYNQKGKTDFWVDPSGRWREGLNKENETKGQGGKRGTNACREKTRSQYANAAKQGDEVPKDESLTKSIPIRAG